MKKVICLIAVIFAVSLFFVPSSHAEVIFNEWVPVTVSTPTNPCNGLDITIVGMGHIVISEGQNKNRYRESYHVNAILIGEDSDGNMYYGEATQIFHLNTGTSANQHYVFNLTMESETGPDFMIHVLLHITVNANGEVTAEIDTYEVECLEE